MLIDMHHHYIPKQYLERVRRDGERWQAVFYHDEALGKDSVVPGMTVPPPVDAIARGIFWMEPGMYDVPTRLEEMAALGIDMAALSISPLLYYYFAEPELGEEVAQLLNDEIHAVAQSEPERFVPMGTVPLQDVGRAIAEMERVVREYGFTAVEIGGSVEGQHYDEPEFEAFFRRAAELDLLIFIHPGINPMPTRLQRYHTGNVIGFPVESGVCAAALIYGGMLARYPTLKICFAHGGGIVPGLIGRWDHGWEVRAESQQRIDRPPSTYFQQLYFDNLVHSDTVLEALLSIASPERVVVGTDYPYDMGERQPGAVLERAEAAGRLTPAQREAVSYQTAARLLRIPV